MSNGDINKFKELLGSAFTYARQAEIPSPIDLAKLGGLIRFFDQGFSQQQYGYEKFRNLLEQVPDVVELSKDDSIYPPRFFANYIGDESIGIKTPVEIKPSRPAQDREIISRNLSEFAVIIRAVGLPPGNVMPEA